MTPISANLQAVHARIETAARAAGRNPKDISLLAVSKTWPAGHVRDAAAAGQRAFGENYVQESVAKIAELAALGLEWHFIGPLQSNKTRPVAEHFDWVHSVDREKIAVRLSEQRPATMADLNICLQVNISGEESKSGVAPEDVVALALRIAALPRISLRGLMAVPEPTSDVAQQRQAFRHLRELSDKIVAQGISLDTLSMGMSSDLHAAIAEGSTMVRIGTGIFGSRNYAK